MKFSFGSNRRDATTKNDVHIRYAPGKRTFPRLRWYFILLIVFSPLFFFLYKMVLPWFFIDSPAVLVMEKALITMPRTGKIVELFGHPGMEVTKGSIFCRIEDDALDDKHERLALLRTRLTSMEGDGLSDASEPGLEKSVALANRILQQQRDNRIVMEGLFRKKAATHADLRLAQDAENRAQADLIQLQESIGLRRLQAQRDMEMLRAERRQLAAEITVLETLIASRDVLCPVAGEIMEMDATEGTSLAQGAFLATIINPESVRIVAYAETDAFPFISKGAVVNVELPGKQLWQARVEYPPYQAQNIPGGLVSFPSGMRRAIRIQLVPVSPMPKEYLIEGLPLIVRWGIQLPEFLKSLVLGKGTA